MPDKVNSKEESRFGTVMAILTVILFIGTFVWIIVNGYINHTPNKSLEVRSTYEMQQDKKSDIEKKEEFLDNLDKEGTAENQWYEKYKEENGYPKN